MDVGSRQAGVIPFRRQSGETHFCLITTSGGGRWTFPKWIVDPGDTVRWAAFREALEEDGLHGALVGPPVGTFHQKMGTEFTVEMYLMDGSQVDETWAEQDVRRRQWCNRDTALTLVRGRPVAGLFQKAIRRLSRPELPALDPGAP